MPTRLCRDPTCDEAATYRGRCAVHARKRNREIRRAGRSIYNSRKWKLTRRRQLVLHPLCLCGRIAEHVHHIIDLDDGGDPWAETNLQSLCAACHSRETRARQVASSGP